VGEYGQYWTSGVQFYLKPIQSGTTDGMQMITLIFVAPRDIQVDLDMAIHQLESAMSRM
jgi:hypothetical protein